MFPQQRGSLRDVPGVVRRTLVQQARRGNDRRYELVGHEVDELVGLDCVAPVDVVTAG